MAIKSDDTGQTAAQWPMTSGPVLLGLAGERGVPGAGGPLRWLFSSIWLFYLIEPVSELFGHHHSVLFIVGGVALTVAFCLIYAPIVIKADKWPRLSRDGLIALILLAALACVLYGDDWTALWIYVSAAGGMVLASRTSRRRAMLGVGVITGLYAVFAWITHLDLGSFLTLLIPVAIIGMAMIGFRMHDLTGQSLSMITLKSDLAAKRLAKLPPSAEREAVLGELGDIGRVSRQTLHDIREAVSGYRRPTLAVEVITARNALEAAGIRLDDDPGLILRSGALDPEAEAVLAWCLREAVTNVIRHSGATSCLIRLAGHGEELSLEVTDDGRGFGETDPAAQKSATRGTGLRGMSERLSAVGGRLSLGPGHPGHGFRLTATVTQEPATGHDGQL
jgi:two-component system sensor histidine kinase DesK